MISIDYGRQTDIESWMRLVQKVRDGFPGLETEAARREPPYDGAKDMLLVEDVDDRAALEALFCAMEPELPAPKPKKTRGT